MGVLKTSCFKGTRDLSDASIISAPFPVRIRLAVRFDCRATGWLNVKLADKS